MTSSCDVIEHFYGRSNICDVVSNMYTQRIFGEVILVCFIFYLFLISAPPGQNL